MLIRFACVAAAILAGCVLAQACSSSTTFESGPSSPTAPSPTPSPPTSTGTVSLTGTVSSKSGSRPLNGVRVTIVDGENAGRTTTTDTDGSYRFDSLQRANANLVANAARFTTVRGGVYIDGLTTLNFALTPALTGTVRSASGDPISGAAIRVLDGPNAGRTTTTNSEGIYRFEDMQEAKANFSATAFRFVEDRREAVVDGNADLDFTLTPFPPFTGYWQGGPFQLTPCPPADACHHYFSLEITQQGERVTGRFASSPNLSQPNITITGLVDGNRLSISGRRTFADVTEVIEGFVATLSPSGSRMSGSYTYRLDSRGNPNAGTYVITFSDVHLVID